MNRIHTFHDAMNDVLPILDSNPDVNMRYLISASEELPGGYLSIVVKEEDMKKMWQIGYDDAKNAIENNAGATMDFDIQAKDYEYFVMRDGFD